MTNWNVLGDKYLELHSNGYPLAVNTAAIVAFGPRRDGPGSWISMIGINDEIMVDESYDVIKQAIIGE
jgi:hypothetical protein